MNCTLMVQTKGKVDPFINNLYLYSPIFKL